MLFKVNRRVANLGGYGASISVPHLPASNLQNGWEPYPNHVSSGSIEASANFDPNSGIQIPFNSHSVYTADEAERVPRTERRTKPSGGGRNKLVNVLGDEAPV